jgi:hypothetical protein
MSNSNSKLSVSPFVHCIGVVWFGIYTFTTQWSTEKSLAANWTEVNWFYLISGFLVGWFVLGGLFIIIRKVFFAIGNRINDWLLEGKE